MKARYLLIFLVVTSLGLGEALGQSTDFAADRPGLSDSPDLIDKGGWQLATGFDLSRYNHYQLWQLSTNTLKYGINERFEARMDFGMQYDKEQDLYGVTAPSFGLKTLLFREKKAIPKTALIVEYYPPMFSNDTQLPAGLGVDLAFSYSFKNGASFYYNVGSDWVEFEEKPTLNSLTGYSFNINPRLNTFFEIYYYKQPEVPLSYIADAGFTFLVNERLQVDISFGANLAKPSGNGYFDGGITYNF